VRAIRPMSWSRAASIAPSLVPLISLPIAKRLSCSAEQAAEGIIRIVDEHMARALRVMSVQRGIDPAELSLISFGGAGALHVCSLAQNLKMKQALIPVHAGVLSALGMLRAPKSRRLSHAVNELLANVDINGLMERFTQLEQTAAAELIQEGVSREQLRFRRQSDLRYKGQSYELTLDWDTPAALVEDFHQAHQRRYGHRLDYPVQLVNLRLAASSPPLPIALPELAAADQEAKVRQHIRLYGFEQPIAMYWRADLFQGHCIAGPALICETASTSYIAPGWECQVDAWGNLLLRFS